MLSLSYKSQSFWFEEYEITINVGVQCSSYKEETNLSSTLKIARYFCINQSCSKKQKVYLFGLKRIQ